MSSADGVESVWVIGTYRGAQAKAVGAHADAGLKYVVVERDGPNSITVAFRFVPDDDGIPHHLQQVNDPWKIEKYEKIRKRRMRN